MSRLIAALLIYLCVTAYFGMWFAMSRITVPGRKGTLWVILFVSVIMPFILPPAIYTGLRNMFRGGTIYVFEEVPVRDTSRHYGSSDDHRAA